MTLKDLQELLKKYPNTKKVNFGTGESMLNPDFLNIMSLCKSKGIKMALTTNGSTIHQLDDEHLKWFSDIDVSLDFPIAKLHDQWRGCPDLFKKTIRAIERCSNLGINISIALCLMNNNYKYLHLFRPILDRFNIFLRINVYKAAWSKQFGLTYDQFWQSMKILADNFKLVSSSEPILSILTKNSAMGSPCGECSLRIHPDKTIAPCVYLKGYPITTDRFNKLKKQIPKFCQGCEYASSCHGGCLSRRILHSTAGDPDEFCPIYHKKEIPNIKFQRAKETELIHASYLCTIIVK